MMKWLYAVLAVMIPFSAVQASADTFRCPNGNLVSTGDRISTVAAKCDPPASTFKREEPIQTVTSVGSARTGTRIIYIEVQEWTYTKGSTLLHTLIFRNGILSEVITGDFIP